MKHVRVNVRSVANTKAVRKEKRNGRDVVIVPSATLPDNIIMNGIMYPADEIEKSYVSLNRTPAPLGHPTINGKFVSARDPEGINLGYIGAWNENVRRENGRVFLDKVIDVEVANRSPGGKEVLAAIEKGEPVHTSTGLIANLEAVSNASDHKHIARNIQFDHDAILLNESGAATPEQGVGMLVNANGEQEEIEVINSSLTEEADREIDWAGTRLVEALRRRENIGIWDKVKAAIMEAVGSGRVPSTNRKEDDMPVSDEQFKSLSDEVKTLSESMAKIGDTIGAAVANAVKPLVDAQNEMVANQKTKEEAEKAELVVKVVKANVLSESAAKELTLNALKELASKAEPGKAAALNGAFKPAGDKPSYKLPEGE
ncbi:hypothetical protein GOD36_25800 [Sinorhizobium medicae]|uniref:hypothetical protein n=1 Tax=Sinorhizobium medicae TaxID=110321 RepID=UPI00037EE8D2|nr:hypothetical protein [Sinorhizobium medicae]MDX0623056.1 hypothetical protein [Sinorhizobium medicae]MDX0765612.1 hypothetical protein [Sinorhizobium medicae]MDX0827089.1 hypothetical protein [Sinorhizobium medicae]PLU14748.1 hypothetical protein BMJ31_25030 [Sinorhizobium medicae]PLU61936.1 hypothetical protein BMJ24_06750 [Sinorhizobium medicae]